MTIILLGLISVMILLAFTLSRRLSGHSQLLTVSDYTQIARYVLESSVNDVIRQINRQVNDPDKDLFETFRKIQKTNGELDIGFYQQSTLLKEMQTELGIQSVGSPKVSFSGVTDLTYPSIIDPTNMKKLEKRGFLTIECSVRFKKRTYALKVDHPFAVVSLMTPVLKDFMFFADQFHLEQRSPFGPLDEVNVLFTKESQHPKTLPSAYASYMGQPWVLWPPTEQKFFKPEFSGRVFLGDDDEPIFLNLAGEKNYRGIREVSANQYEVEGYMSDLWRVWPQWFKVYKPGMEFNSYPIFLDRNVKWVKIRGLQIPLKYQSHLAKIGVLGFCNELIDPNDSFFANSNNNLDSFLGKDPAYQKLKQNGWTDRLALASSLKLYGLNAEPDQPPDKPYLGFPREVYGNVFDRFLLVSFFEFPSADGGGAVLDYNPNANFDPPPFYNFNGDPIKFEMADASQKYGDYMSRIVSGGVDYSQSKGSNYLPSNVVDPTGGGSRVTLGYRDFKPADGLLLKGKFSSFGRAWFAVDPDKNLQDKTLNNVQARVTRFFKDETEFKEYAGDGKSRFWVDGVAYVKGSLTLKDITTQNIRGGVVLVEKGIDLGNITHGIDFKKNVSAWMPELQKLVGELPQRKMLTFVSMSGQPIKLTGEQHVGVQLVSLSVRGMGAPRDQIQWKSSRKIVFCGGIAVDCPGMRNRARDFYRAGSDPIFMYMPCMGEAAPAVAARIYWNMQSYSLTAILGRE